MEYYDLVYGKIIFSIEEIVLHTERASPLMGRGTTLNTCTKYLPASVDILNKL